MFSFLLALINWNPRRWAGGCMHRVAGVAFIEILYNIIGHQTAERAEKKGCRLCVLSYYSYLGLIWPSSLLPLITLWRIRKSVYGDGPSPPGTFYVFIGKFWSRKKVITGGLGHEIETSNDFKALQILHVKTESFSLKKRDIFLVHFRVLNNTFLVRKYFLHKKSIDRRPTLDIKAINAWMQNLNIFSV
jgi:hypothetical protein